MDEAAAAPLQRVTAKKRIREKGWRRQGSMENILRCFTGGNNHGDDYYPHYHPTSKPSIGLQAADWGSPPRVQPDHHQLGRHGGVASGPAQLRIHIHGNICTVILSLPSLIPLCLLVYLHFAIYSVTVSPRQYFFLGRKSLINIYNCKRKIHIYIH